MNMNTLATIHTKFHGETMFCFVCIATFFGYILGVNKVIECVVAKHSNNNISIKMCNKYTQTNLNDLVEYLSSKNVIVEQVEKYSNELRRGMNDESGESNEEETGVKSDNNDNVDNNTNDNVDNNTNNNNDINDNDKNGNVEETQGKEETQEQVQSPQSVNSDAVSIHSNSNSNSEEDYEVVKKNENVSVSKNKIKFFEWFSIL